MRLCFGTYIATLLEERYDFWIVSANKQNVSKFHNISSVSYKVVNNDTTLLVVLDGFRRLLSTRHLKSESDSSTVRLGEAANKLHLSRHCIAWMAFLRIRMQLFMNTELRSFHRFEDCGSSISKTSVTCKLMVGILWLLGTISFEGWYYPEMIWGCQRYCYICARHMRLGERCVIY